MLGNVDGNCPGSNYLLISLFVIIRSLIEETYLTKLSCKRILVNTFKTKDNFKLYFT